MYMCTHTGRAWEVFCNHVSLWPFSPLTLADALLLFFPPEPLQFLSFWSCLSNLLFSTSNVLFCSKSNLTSSSALSRFTLRCSLSFSRVLNSAAKDRTFWVDGFKLPRQRINDISRNKSTNLPTKICDTRFDKWRCKVLVIDQHITLSQES